MYMKDLITPNFTIYHKRQQKRLNLLQGIVWLLLGVIGLFVNKEHYFFYGYIALGFFHLWAFFQDKYKGYISVFNGILKTHYNPFFNKQINLNEVNKVIKLSDTRLLKTNSEEIKIHTSLISEESMQKLNEVIDVINERVKTQNLTQ
ncbi:hypothetical protein C7H61_13015 [Mesoflavibacter zeaxanthinifaciens subsp. sabulilitoris]|uniref:DUF304 domain-containing protein n=2 Tax=Mesoflavibacter TaxID=444051 RepID=A0A2T1N5Z6_9FLAO|nr:hypothetical protein C7H61_13015 [Mesoflavibacter zeaxanthinifaciens subsp. sabulilitoris]